MTWAIRSIYNGYFRGEWIERAADCLLGKICQPHQSQSADMCRTTAKVAAYWVGISLVGVVAEHFLPHAPIAVGAITLFCSIPFLTPLSCNAKTVITEANNRLPLYKRVHLAVTWVVFVCMQAGAVYWIGREFPEEAVFPFAFAISTLTVGGALLVTMAIFNRPVKEKEPSLEDLLIADCNRLEVNNAELKMKIRKIDRFVADNPDLIKVIKDHIEKYPESIARGVESPHIDVDGPNDWIGLRTKMSIENIDLEYWLDARMRFVEMHAEVRKCFEKHILAMQNGQNLYEEARPESASEAGSSSIGGVRIEEMPDNFSVASYPY